MSNYSNNYGQHVKRFVYTYCAECGDTVSCAPGDLSIDGVDEYRKCEDGHLVKTEAIYYCPPSEATEFDLG